MDSELTYVVPGMSCENCRTAVSQELSAVEGVTTVGVDLETKLVTVTGDDLNDATLREAIEDAGYEALP